jgi:Bacterial protein of unknown function (DUF885)
MKTLLRLTTGALLAAVLICCAPRDKKPGEVAAGPSPSGDYDGLVALCREFRAFEEPRVTNGVPDYTPAAMAEQKRRLPDFQSRLAVIDPSAWSVSRRVDYEIVRAEMNGLEFDHRVLRPWARDPSFYAAVTGSEPDVPAREGPEIHGVLNLFEYDFPLGETPRTEFRKKLEAIPAVLAQAQRNLVAGGRELWSFGIRQKKEELEILDGLAARLAAVHPDLVPLVERAKASVADFLAWLEKEQPLRPDVPDGIGVEEFDWSMKNVHLVPYTWQEQEAMLSRELERAWASLRLEESRNRDLPPLAPPATAEELRARTKDGVAEFMDFLRRRQIFTVPGYMRLNDLAGPLLPPERRDFFTQISYHDPLPLLCHSVHWLEKARDKRFDHPIRRGPLLSNIWDSRAEGFATAFEETLHHAGLLDRNPRARELTWILLAFRAARGMGDLKLHSREWTLQDAVRFAVEQTPRGWVRPDGNTIWGDLGLYLRQPGYGTSYVYGKLMFEKLLAERGQQLGGRFGLGDFLDDYFSRGIIPASLLRWEMTGRDGEVRALGLLERTPSLVAEAGPADADLLGLKEVARPEDPDFASAAAYLPTLKRPREVVGVPHHPHDIGVAPDGSLELSDDADAAGSPVAFFEIGDPPVRFGAGVEGCAKRLLDGWLPVVIASQTSDGLDYEETVFGYAAKMSPDEELWAYAALEVRNPGAEPREVRLGFRVEPGPAALPRLGWTLKLAPGVSGAVQVKVPFGPPAPGRFHSMGEVSQKKRQEVGREEYEGRLNEVRTFWVGRLGAGLQLAVPETRVNDAWRAWLAYASLDVDKRNGVLEPHDGAGFYEEVYGYSAALYANALDLWGRHDEARAILESLLTFLTPDGLFSVNFGLPDQGALLSALADHFEFTGDEAWLSRVAPRIIRMADWIAATRREAAAADQPLLGRGLISFRPYCDFAGATYDYFGDTYCCLGLERASRVLASLGLAAEAERIGKEAAAYRRDILASMDAATIERGGVSILPMEPVTHRLLQGTGYRSGGYYGLIASCMLETGFLPAADERALRVARFIEAKGGLRLGMSEFGGGIDHAYSYGYWLDSLKRDEVGKAILGFYGSLAHGMTRETYSGVEVTKLFTGDNDSTLPHLYSCTQQLRLLRMLLVREEGDDLWLGQAVPRLWLAAGRRVEVRGAATTHGPVSFVLESRPDGSGIEATIAVPSRTPVKRILLRFRTPGRRPLRRVLLDGRPLTTFTEDTVTLDSPRGTVRIAADYGAERGAPRPTT